MGDDKGVPAMVVGIGSPRSPPGSTLRYYTFYFRCKLERPAAKRGIYFFAALSYYLLSYTGIKI
jgi:hypothetical protein